VRPGDRIPVDGVVVHGRSSVEEAAFTGEPLPVTKQTGDTVSAGTINCDGALVVEVVNAGEDTMLADVVRLVEEAQARTAPVQVRDINPPRVFVEGRGRALGRTMSFTGLTAAQGWDMRGGEANCQAMGRCVYSTLFFDIFLYDTGQEGGVGIKSRAHGSSVLHTVRSTMGWRDV